MTPKGGAGQCPAPSLSLTEWEVVYERYRLYIERELHAPRPRDQFAFVIEGNRDIELCLIHKPEILFKLA